MQVGDKIIYVGGGAEWNSYLVGKTGTITRVGGKNGTCDVRWDHGRLGSVRMENIRHSKQATLKWIKENL